MTTGDATTASSTPDVPSVRDFYDGLYHSPLFAAHHKICCNVGFYTDIASPNTHVPALAAAPAAAKFHAANQTDAAQLALYRALLSVAPLHELPSSTEQQLHILDVGCGAGGGLCELQSLFPAAHVTGVDISSQALARARETWTNYVARSPDVLRTRELTLLHETCEKLRGVATQSIDVVVAVQTLQEVQRLPRALAELARVLKPNGLLFIADFIPHDATTDRLYIELLGPLADGQADTAAFEVVHEVLATSNVALGCQQSSPMLSELIATHLPRAFHDEMRTFFLVEHTRLFDQLQRDDMGYRLVCLRRTTAVGSTSTNDKVDDADSVYSSAYDSADDDDDDDDSSSDDEIDDHDLPNYYTYTDVYPQLEALKDNYDTIRDEMEQVLASSSWPFWPEKHYADGNNEWRVFPFCYTFPAHDASKTTWVAPTCDMCPRTVEVLKQIPGIRTALFSKLGPGTTLSAHRGWADLSNHILRCHLGLVVPTYDDGAPCCAMVVGNERCAHRERELLVFDDSKLHFAYNRHSTATRIVLIVDLYRPDDLPRGRATGGHSDELDEFIETFGRQVLADAQSQ